MSQGVCNQRRTCTYCLIPDISQRKSENTVWTGARFGNREQQNGSICQKSFRCIIGRSKMKKKRLMWERQENRHKSNWEMGRVVALILAIVNVTLAATIDLTKQKFWSLFLVKFTYFTFPMCTRWRTNGKWLTITVSQQYCWGWWLWITNNFNYEQQTFVANKTDYDFEFVDIVGERISFWVQTWRRKIVESVLVTPMSPQIKITCGQNCEMNTTVNFANNR